MNFINPGDTGKINHSLNQIFHPQDQEERKICQLAIQAILQKHSVSEEQVRHAFAPSSGTLSERSVQNIVQQIEALQEAFNNNPDLSSSDPSLLQDRLRARSRDLDKMTSLPEGHLVKEATLVEKVFSSGIPLTQMGMLEAKALLAIASPLYKKKQEDGVPHEQAVKESVEESYQELQSCLLKKLPKCSLSGHPIRHPAYVNKEEFLDNNRPLNYYELEELERYALRTHQTPLFSDGQKLPFSLSDICLDEAKQTEIDQARKATYQEVLQKYPPASEDEALIVAIKHLEETRDDGISSSISSEGKALLEQHSCTDLALLSLAYPLYQEESSLNSLPEQRAEESAKKAQGILKERLDHDPVLSRYRDVISLELIRDPIETVVRNGQSAYYDISSKKALKIGDKDPFLRIPIQEIKEAPHVRDYLTKRKEQICHELISQTSSRIQEAIQDKNLVEAVSLVQITPPAPVSLEEFFEAAKSGDLKTVQEGLKQGLSINATGGSLNRTALMLAALRGHTNIVQYLLSQENIDLNAQDHAGKTAMMLAAALGHTNVVQYLASREGIDLNARDHGGATALILAAGFGQLDIVQYLASQKSVDLNAKNHTGKTALTLAAACEKLDIVQYLASQEGIDLNAKDHTGKTALMWATILKHFDIVQCLASQKGIDFSIKDDNGMTTYQIALQNDHHDIAEYLKNRTTA
ncbi:MAG: ankyrin repeat domain-containing protein [Chlamydiae bacterium]|nr:ankyrin repeat domain-containing protein [Chlamydiota bacterium]